MTETASQPLTGRVDEIARMAARGLSYGQIAHALTLSQSTVRTHIHKAYGHLGATSRGDFLRRYQRSKVPAAAAIMHGETGKLTVEVWERLLVQMLDALEEA